MRNPPPISLFCLSLLLPFSAAPAMAEEPAQASGEAPKPVSYYHDVRPIFQAQCHGCHQPAKAKGDYIMTDFAKLLAGGDSGDAAIVPGKPEMSILIDMILPFEGEAEMPQKDDPLHEAEIGLISRWIAEGAEDDTPANARQRYDMDNPPEYTLPPVITSIDFSPDGTLLAVAGFHEVLLHKADGSGLVARLVGLAERIESVAFSPDGTKLAVTGGMPARMGEVQIWDVAKRELEVSVPVTYDTVYGASWSPDGGMVAFGCTDTTVRAIEVASGEEVLYQGAHDDWPLDTVFSMKGTHIASVGRDQSTKLIEVETERFVDNITSITPGALKGGVHAIARHPERDEVLVGGADGVPQIYRMYRETKRVIGDNANLIRKFPPMTGRIFAVAFSSDGKRIVAGSSLDGKGWVNIYSSEYDSSITDELKTIFEKVSTSRSAEENRIVEEYRTREVEQLQSIHLDAGVYAVAFTPDNAKVVAAGSDGIIRFFDAATGELVRDFLPVKLDNPDWSDSLSLSVEPAFISLKGGFDYSQLLVSAITPTGGTRDVTREAEFELTAPVAVVDAHGRISPLEDGAALLRVRQGGRTAVVPVKVEGAAETPAVDYVRDVMPVLSKAGCNTGTCHGSKDGKNGFKLSLRGYDPIYDIRSFTDDLSSRRVNVASPDNSLMLMKATGAVPHEGGQVIKPDSDYYKIIRSWIASGAKLDLSSPRVTKITMSPEDPVVQKIGDDQQFRILAEYSDGSKRDVTSEAFIESSNIEIATADGKGVVNTLRRGEAPILARFEGAYAATIVTVMGDRSGFEWEEPPAFNPIDGFVADKLERMKILSSGVCTDESFVRRIHLDLTGLPPTVDQVRAFLADGRESQEKRNALVDSLIGSEPFVDYWTNKWGDLLQVNRKFLGAEGAKLFHEWIRQEVANNTPYDEFAKKILVASGSNRENPAASYYKVLRTPEDTMENTTHLFLATRFNCNKCHDHPFERWTQDQYYEMAAFFARVDLQRDPESGDRRIGGTAVEGAKPLYEIVQESDKGEVIHDRTGQVAPPSFPYEAEFSVDEEGASRRERLASWITSADNRYFATSYVNRIWGYLTGRGLIEPLDDIRAGNPPSNPELLEHLTAYFIESDFDTRALMRYICQSRTYQLEVATNRWNEDDTVNYSHAKARRLPAEVLYDAIYATTGTTPKIPGVPVGTRAAQLPDVGVQLADGFLGNLGRPERESACECERSQDLQLGAVMALVSGPTVGAALSDPDNGLAQLANSDMPDPDLVNELYLRILSRPASDREKEIGVKTIHQLDEEHAALVGELEAWKKELVPIQSAREKAREEAVAAAKNALGAYEAEIADREAELDRQRAENIAQKEAALAEYRDGAFAKKYADWLAGVAVSTSWIPLEFAAMDAENGSKLEKLDDLSIFASGANGKGAYNLTAKLDPSTKITGVRIEVLPDDRLPARGPGRANDGNFVLTEFEVFRIAEGAEPEQLKLKDAKADYSQGGYDVTTAIDGTRAPAGNGWAVSNKFGVQHTAVFSFEQPVQATELKLVLDQQYQGNDFSIGRFRVSFTTWEGDLDLGLPGNIDSLLSLDRDERTEDQNKALLEYFRGRDGEYQSRVNALAEAMQPRPVDPKLVELREKVARAERPVAKDPKLEQLERAVALSEEQLKNKRLTAAQDIAWALINSPAFLFNH